MGFWEQFAIMQAQAALHTIIRKYGKEYFSEEEQTALDITIDALIDLPARIHAPAKDPLSP